MTDELQFWIRQANKNADKYGKQYRVVQDTVSGSYQVYPESIPVSMNFKEIYLTGEEIMINELVEKVHDNAKKHGWWQDERTVGDIIALCHAELSEALEEYRNGHKPNETYFNGAKPEGIPTELADVIIRIMDYCGHEGIDLEKAITDKMVYNETRPYKHGGKVL